jgi:hypothetical protein
VSTPSESPTKRIEALTAHVVPELADEVRRLAAAGERSVSRQVAIAVREHVETARAVEPGQRAESPERAARPPRESTGPAHTGEAA